MEEKRFCRQCNLIIAPHEKQDHIGNFWFHVDETKNCLVKYLRGRQTANLAYEGHKIPEAPVKIRKPRWRLMRRAAP